MFIYYDRKSINGVKYYAEGNSLIGYDIYSYQDWTVHPQSTLIAHRDTKDEVYEYFDLIQEERKYAVN